MSELTPGQTPSNGDAQPAPTAPVAGDASTSPEPPPDVGDVAASGGGYYRNARFVLAVALFLYGIWSIHDGFFSWPRENAAAIAAEIAQGQDPKPRHSNADIQINDALGCALPPLSILLVIWTLYNSRGQIRLDGQTLTIPGHPPIPLSKVESVDKQRWDRKGIALVNYQLDNGQKGTFKLDDFGYEREPVDRIFARIEKALLEPRPAKLAPVVAAIPRPATPPRPMRMPPRPGR